MSAPRSIMLLLLLSLSSFSSTIVLADAGTSSEEGVSYLVSHAQEPGVVVLPSGLQYKILRHGSGTYHPTEKTSCSFHYVGKLATNGNTFDSSRDREQPTDVRPDQAIQGWSEAMKLMREGDKWELTIPSHLAYGDRALPALGVPANAVLIYEVELLALFGPTTPAASPCTVIGASSASRDEIGKEAPLKFVECNAKEETYASKVHTQWTSEKLTSEITRLLELKKKGNVKAELREWMEKRVRILNYVVSFGNNVEYDEGRQKEDDTDLFDFRHDHDHDHEGGHSHGNHGHHRHDNDHHDAGHDHGDDRDGHDHGHDHGHGHHHHDHEL
eukprot:CAMPEP_0194275786 /NCGR_PEP_ID=MMETSP0169-20130528/8545_1 /TAXON_ID=218684 /ORGANISM="Corethron pennatum, Strain L29A3" /LENGTH=328 /DNA_ID=CAMNT_0039019341 /DNA_START=99 /DNA_END=1085 /DNA_ORIENTATION=-